MQFTTWIEAEVPRVECATHGVTIVPDLDRPRLLYLADERKQASLDGFWPTLTPAQREGITAVAMDMWEPYVQSTRAHLPEADAKIVFDKFHVVKHLHDAVDHVRRGEHPTLQRSRNASVPSGSIGIPERPGPSSLAGSGARPHRPAQAVWRPSPKLIQPHLPNLLTYLRHRLTNAGTRGPQRHHPRDQEDGPRFRNAEHFKTAIYFHCGGS
jgi:transposase